jgi:hypothetical protein
MISEPTRTPFFTAARLIAAAALVATGPAIAQPIGGFEPAPSLPGSELAPAALLKGPLHKVAEPVALDGYFGRFVIESSFGKFTVVGESMLAMRVHELPAIEALQKVNKSAAFQDAMAKSAASSVKFVVGAVDDPGKAVESVGKGIGSVFGRIAYAAKSGAESAGDAASDMAASSARLQSQPAPAGEPEPPSFTGDPFGYNKARREWAKKLNIDPYTTNPVLRPLLNDAASASFAGSFAVDTALGAVAAPLNMAVEFDSTVREAVWNQPVIDLQKQNEASLIAMGVNERTVRDFLRNKWFTPTAQTALTSALSALGKVDGRESVIQVAAQVQGETRVRFLLDSVRMLVRYQEKSARFTALRMSNLVPVGITADGTLVAAAAVDYAYWNEDAALFAQRKDLGAKKRVLLVAGKASNRAKLELEKAGLSLASGQRP